MSLRRGTVALVAAGWVVALIGLTATPARPASPAFHGLRISPAAPVAEFVLLDQHRRQFSMRAQQGRAVILAFGYTHCPDVCPATMGMLKRVHAELRVDAGRVRFVFVTTDPARDTPERLTQYLALFHVSFVGLTGDRVALARVYRDFGIYPERYTAAASAASYLVSHATAVYLIDPAGLLRFSYPWAMRPQDFADDIRLVLSGN